MKFINKKTLNVGDVIIYQNFTEKPTCEVLAVVTMLEHRGGTFPDFIYVKDLFFLKSNNIAELDGNYMINDMYVTKSLGKLSTEEIYKKYSEYMV